MVGGWVGGELGWGWGGGVSKTTTDLCPIAGAGGPGQPRHGSYYILEWKKKYIFNNVQSYLNHKKILFSFRKCHLVPRFHQSSMRTLP